MQQTLASAQLWTPPNVGHSVQVEMPEEFNRRVLQFLCGVRA
jgi:pimeloyl-ACP methyl ester carboxylesterase